MGIRTATSLVLVAAVSAHALELVAQDLEPEEGVFAGYGPPDPYELALRRALLGEDRYRLCQLVVLPSFAPESAVYMVRGEKPGSGFTVFSRTMRKQVWTGMMKKLEKASDGRSFSLNDTSQRIALDKLRKAVEVRSAGLDTPTGERLDQVCARVLLRVRYPKENTSGLDGTSYHAGHWVPGAFLAGKTWSPEKGTLAESFVEMALAMKKYSEATEPKRAAAKDDLVRRAELVEKQLEARNVGVEPANKALQTDGASPRR